MKGKLQEMSYATSGKPRVLDVLEMEFLNLMKKNIDKSPGITPAEMGLEFSNCVKRHMDKDLQDALKETSDKSRNFDTLGVEFLNFMSKYQLMLTGKSLIFLDKQYNQISRHTVTTLLRTDGFFERWGTDCIMGFLDAILHPGIIGTLFRGRIDIPIYIPIIRYIQFADCIYDIFEGKELDVQTKLDSDGTTIYPWCTLGKSLRYYSEYIPFDYFMTALAELDSNKVEPMLNKYLSTNKNVNIQRNKWFE